MQHDHCSCVEFAVVQQGAADGVALGRSDAAVEHHGGVGGDGCRAVADVAQAGYAVERGQGSVGRLQGVVGVVGDVFRKGMPDVRR